MGSEDETFFHVVFPREETKRRAAKGLFQVLGKFSYILLSPAYSEKKQKTKPK